MERGSTRLNRVEKSLWERLWLWVEQTTEKMTNIWLVHSATILSDRLFNKVEHLLTKLHVVTQP